MNEKYLECLAEISLKKYQESATYALKLEARVAELIHSNNSLREENESLVKKLEQKNKRTPKDNG